MYNKIEEIVEKIVSDKTAGYANYAKSGDPRYICISQGTASAYCIHYGLTDYEWAEVVRECKARGIGTC